MKISYSEYDLKHGGLIKKKGFTEKMKRCYENYDERTHSFTDDNHCGTSRRVEKNFFVCPNGGNFMKICGYLGVCGGINKPKELEEKQLSFF